MFFAYNSTAQLDGIDARAATLQVTTFSKNNYEIDLDTLQTNAIQKCKRETFDEVTEMTEATLYWLDMAYCFSDAVLRGQ